MRIKSLLNKQKILYIDDEDNNLFVFEHTFNEYFEVLTASSAHRGLLLLEKEPVPLIIADQRMPNMTGVEFFEIVQEMYPKTIRILLTGFSEPKDIIAAINRGGVYQYIVKPWNEQDLLVILQRAMEHYNLDFELEKKQQELFQASKLALLGEFTAGIAHDLASPISSFSFCLPSINRLLKPVKAYLDERHGEEVSKLKQYIIKAEEIIGVLNHSTSLLFELIANLKDFSKKELNERSLLNVNAGLESMLLVLSHEYRKKELKMIKNFGDLPEIMCYPGQINQVFMNVLKNAIQATPEASKVEITTALVDSTWLNITIQDQGSGIEENIREDIFKPFMTSKSVDSDDSSMGLGLSISKDIIEQHRGKIYIQSTSSEGTTFKIELPVDNKI